MNRDEHLWILEFKYDAITSSIHIVLTSDPERGTQDRVVDVSNVSNFHVERYHDADAVTLGDYTGCSISAVGKYWRYKMDTGDATVTFDALDKITI